jgi:hypothetical protein
MPNWLTDNIDSVPPSMAARMKIAVRLMALSPSYIPPIERWKTELARYQSRKSFAPITPETSTCPPHATWCPRFGLPTGPHACEVCTAERDTDPAFAVTLRYIGDLYGAARCVHRQDTGEHREQTCCGGKIKQVPIVRCGRTGKPADCRSCREKELSRA